MDKKIAHTLAGSKRKTNFKDNSAHNQRLKILDWLFEKGSITTAQAREYLDIMSPAPRIWSYAKRVIVWTNKQSLPDKPQMLLKCDKQRHGEWEGSLALRLDHDSIRFSEC